MRALIVASSGVPAEAQLEIQAGRRPRLDYAELASRLDAPYVDYDSQAVHHNRFLAALESTFRLDAFRAAQIARKVHNEGYDAVMSWSERVAIPLAYLLRPGIRHVALLHKPLSPYKLAALRRLRVYRRWDQIFTYSRAEADALQQAFALGEERVRPLAWGIDTDFYQPAALPPREGEKPHILSVGVCNRDYPTLIEAMRRIPHIDCHICATSAWAGEADPLAGEAPPPNVRLRRYDHPAEIRQAYARCRFAVIPMRTSTTQWSAGCTSVLQPQAMGKPVVATRLPGLGDYVVEGRTGQLVDGADPAKLASAIDELWRDEARIAAMGRRGAEWVLANHSLEGCMDAIIDAMGGFARDAAPAPHAAVA